MFLSGLKFPSSKVKTLDQIIYKASEKSYNEETRSTGVS